jgi:four helix bundle protein
LGFGGQIQRSSRSVAANIAEGYGYFRPRLFAKHLRIARASAMETRNHIIEGRTKHFSPEDSARFLRLCKRIIPGTSRLIEYLDSCDPNLDLRPAARDLSERPEPAESREPLEPLEPPEPPEPN